MINKFYIAVDFVDGKLKLKDFGFDEEDLAKSEYRCFRVTKNFLSDSKDYHEICDWLHVTHDVPREWCEPIVRDMIEKLNKIAIKLLKEAEDA